MKKVSTLSNYILLGIFLSVCALSTAQDFRIQEVQDDVANDGTAEASGYAEVTNITTGFTAVTSTASAFALPSNNRKTHGGPSGSTAVREGDDMAGARVLTAGNTITYYREAGSQLETTRFNTTLWEYTGTVGGNNEFIVRERFAVDLNGGTYTSDELISASITNKDKCIPFITGIMNDSATDNADSGTAIAYLTSSTNLRVEKGGTNTPNVRVYITLVEFTGSNWTVLHGDSGNVSAETGTITLNDDSDGSSGTATDVSDWANSIIFSQHRGDTATGGSNDAHGDNWPSTNKGSDDRSVDWTFHTAHDSDGTNRHFVHILNNSDVTVTRFSDATVGNATVDITSAGLTDVSQSMIVGSTYHSGTGQGYGRGWRNYKINTLTQAEYWSARVGGSGATVGNELQIIDFATSPTQTVGPGGITTNLELWLKADTGVEQAASVAAVNNDQVLNWLDNTVNTNDATQTTGVNKPIFKDNTINFNPTVDFDGTSHEMAASTATNDEITIFAVAEGTYSSTKSLIDLDNAANGSVYVEQTAATTFQGSYTDSASSTSGVVSNDLTATTSGTPYLINYRHLAADKSRLLINGNLQTVPGVNTNANTLSGNFTAGIGADLSSSSTRWDGGIAEMIVYNYKVPQAERWQIESYLGIKYGITIGVNGTSQDYVDSDNTIIWDQSDDAAAFNYNVTGIGRDDTSELNQKQSKTINTTNDITVGIKDIATNNSLNTNTFFADKTFLMWGHDDGGTSTAADITKDFSAGTSITSNASVTPITQKWKMVVTDSVPTIKLSIPESMVSGTNAGGEDYVMIVADDASFTTNVTSATMEDVGSELEVDFYFEGTKFITFGSTTEIDLGDRSVFFDGSDSYLTAGDVNDLANMDYTISAWVRRDSLKMDIVSKRNYFHEAPGPPSETYTHGYAFRINSTGQFRMVWRDPVDATNNIMQTDATIPWNEWHHIAATYNSSEGLLGTTRLYIDGILEDTDDTLDPIDTPSDAHFMIGAAHHIKRQQRAKGNIDEVRVWNVALSSDQIRYIINQEIEKNNILGTDYADGKVIPTSITKNEIVPIPWNNLIAYYPMSTQVFGSIKDESNSGNDASMINFDGIDTQTAPLPYVSTQDGAWDTSATWVNGDVQYLPGVDTYLVQEETIDYNIVQINHAVTMENKDTSLIPAANNDNRTVLGLMINSGGDLEVVGDTSAGEGNALTVSHYLKIDGTLDLEGESQLIQTTDSDFDTTSTGTLERDQQGTSSTYIYNYWCSPVAPTSNGSYTLPDIINNVSFLTSGYNGTTAPANADYWIWKYANLTADTYSLWQHVRSTGSLLVGQGFTMKGPGTVTTDQNYILQGQPNNGDFSLSIAAGSDYLIGNPYPSALDADEFIKDNISAADGGKAGNTDNVINGVLYFWDHFSDNTHKLAEYEGGYATYTLMGGAVAVNNDVRINSAAGGSGTKEPERYIPVGQGFFVSAILDTDVTGNVSPVDGGTILFKNSQRVFQKEEVTVDNTGSVFTKSTKKGNVIKSKAVDTRQKIRLMFDSPKGYHRQLLVGVDQNASNDFDLGYDGPLNESNKEDMYWKLGPENLVIQAVNNFNPDQILPLGMKIAKNGLATIRIDKLENVSDLDIYIHDKELNVYHNLNESSYQLSLDSGEYQDRFEITFSNPQLLSTDDVLNDNLEVYYSNEKERIIINNPTLKHIQSIKMYSILGQLVLESNINSNENYLEISKKQIHTGIYIIKLKSENSIISKKVQIH
ncbi:hypothetical protein GCM10023311_28880 [Flaviramulus aquimarinus]|uniref:LamG-like jellyroll fold domain-containing protein n=1 Tax=Flaviramulus aquimarinus TaxID=1170456 RepID=A0ABP9FGB6_9FLAO